LKINQSVKDKSQESKKKERAHTIRVANMAKAVVKSSQEMGNWALRLVSSRTSMRMETQKQKHQVNMHHVQKEFVLWPTDATRLKEIQVKTTSSIRTASVLMSSVTMAIVITWFWIEYLLEYLFAPTRLFDPC